VTESTFTSETPTASQDDVQRLAWGVLLGAFIIFCAILAGSVFTLNYFLFRSTVSGQSFLIVGRGTVGITDANLIEQVERDRRHILNNQTVRTDAQSQASISFMNQQNNNLIVAITVKSNTSLLLDNFSRPRFDWSRAPYNINLKEFSGELDVFVVEDIDRRLQLTIETMNNMIIDVSQSGQYRVSASPSQVRVINRAGNAIILDPTNPAASQSVPAGEQIIFQFANPTNDPDNATVIEAQIVQTPALIDLIENSTFQNTHIPERTQPDEVVQPLPLDWACGNGANNVPQGKYSVAKIDGRTALHMVRSENASTHGETFCIQAFGTDSQQGFDVSQFDHLSLQATMYVNYQSLNACGVEGSECPLMLRLDYIDANGEPARLFQGFYTTLDPQLGYPLGCSAECIQEHQIINQKAWYTYDSGNLFSILTPEKRPSAILNLRFYASGHQYDVYVGEVAVLTGNTVDLQPFNNFADEDDDS